MEKQMNEKAFDTRIIAKTYIKYAIIIGVLFAVYGIALFLIQRGILDSYTLRVIKTAGIFMIAAFGLNLILGYTGQLTMGHAAFMSIGAYGSAIMTQKFNMPYGVSLLVGILAAAVLAAAIGYPILRLKGDYLAICTLGFGEIVKVVIQNIDYVGGARGMTSIPVKTSLMTIFFCVALCFAIIKNLIHSSRGRAIMSVREDDIAAEAMGINPTKYKMISFILGSAMAGLAGGLYAHFNTFIDPVTFNYAKSFDFITYVVLGGMGSVSGTVVGTSILVFLPESLRGLSEVFKENRMLIYAVMLVALMIFRPNGILGTKEITVKGIANWCKKVYAKITHKGDKTAKAGE